MPIYEYKCDDCGTKFEKLVRRSEETDGLVCPSCGEKHLKQEFSTFAAQVSNGGPKQGSRPICPSTGSPCSSGMCGVN